MAKQATNKPGGRNRQKQAEDLSGIGDTPAKELVADEVRSHRLPVDEVLQKAKKYGPTTRVHYEGTVTDAVLSLLGKGAKPKRQTHRKKVVKY